jgi:putative ABC transport system permease protein
MVAIDLANSSASRAFDISTDAIAGKTTHQIVGSANGFNDSIYQELATSGRVVSLTPIVFDYITSPQLGNRPFTLLGIDPFTDTQFRNYFSADGEVPVDQLSAFLTIPGAILISTGLAERYQLSPCSTLQLNESEDFSACSITIQTNGTQQAVYIVGLIEPEDRLAAQALDSIILTDIASAQELLGKVGLLDRIDVILFQEPDSSKLNETQSTEDFLRSYLPEGIRLQRVADTDGTVQEMTEAFRVNLTALSLLALLVGLFLIYNTITFSVVQRRPLFGILRCLGVTRREIFLLVLVEALLVGLIGSTLGVICGIFLGQGAVRLVTQTINDLFFVISVQGVQIPTTSLIKGFLIGVTATILTAVPPGWEAAAVEPRTALFRSGLEEKAHKAVGWVAFFGGILIISGAAILLLIPTNDLVISFGGTFAVIVGFAMLTPLITEQTTRVLSPLLGKIWGALGRIAPRDLSKSVSRISIAIAALMIAVAVTIGVSLMINSFRFTIDTWLGQTLQGDIYISTPGLTTTQPGSAIDPKIVKAVLEQEGVAEIASLRAVTVGSTVGSASLTAIDQPVRNPGLFLSANGTPEQVWKEMQEGAVIVSEPFASRHQIPEKGGVIQLYSDIGLVAFPVAGIISDYASTQGIIRMEMEIYQKYWNDESISALALFLEPGSDLQEITRRLQVSLAPIQDVFVRPNQELRSEALSIFDRTFAITGAMQILATLVAFVGVLSTMLAIQLEKKRQMGILRSIGLTVRQLWGLVLLQTSIMGTIAGLLAIPTGYVLSLILIHIINRRSFGWTLQTQIDPEPFIVAMLVSVSASLIAGLYPAYKTGKMAAVDALRSD